MLTLPGDVLTLARAGYVLAREGVIAAAAPDDVAGLPKAAVGIARLVQRRAPADRGAGLSAALTRLGPSWVKLGQFLATRPDVVGVELAKDLGALQDRMPPFSQAVALAEIGRALGQPAHEIFAEVTKPVAAASIAQVHRARIETGEGSRTVAVKVLRPGITRRFKRDLGTYYRAARFIAAVDPRARRLRPIEVVDTLARSAAFEMDLRLEAAALSEMGDNTKNDIGFRVPKPDWSRTARTVLTMEWIDGTPLSDSERLRQGGHDLPALGRNVIQSFLRHAIRDGFFHADMHPGNLLVEPDGTLVAVDFGIMGRLGLRERRYLAEILYGFITRDYRRVAQVHFDAGYVPPHQRVDDFAQAIRAIGEPIHNRKASEISMARLLTLLFEVTELFDMHTRLELVMLQKTMVVVEGVARTLDPDLDMWSTADPVVRSWIERHLGPVGLAVGAGAGAAQVGRILSGLPDTLQRLDRVIEDLDPVGGGGLRLSPETVKAIASREARSGGAIALGVWALVVLLAVWLFG